MAARISLPPSHGWMTDGDIWKPCRGDIDAALGVTSGRRRSAPVAIVSALRTAAEVEVLRAQLETRNPDCENWNFDESIDCLTYDRMIGPDRFGLSVRRPGRRKGEGILVGQRAVQVVPNDGRMDVNYHVELGFIYVVPAASGQRQGAALVAGACAQINHDLEALAQVLKEMGESPKVTAVVAGEAYSAEGLAILNAVSDVTQKAAKSVFGRKGTCERDFAQRVLQSHFG